jgi:VRR-NUC domain-containing protein
VRVKVSARISEKGLQAQVGELARLCGFPVYHTHDSRHSAPGFPDLVLARPPVIRFVELKTDTGRLRPQQRA